MSDRPSLPGLLRPERELQAISNDLAVHFRGIFTEATVERYVSESYLALARTAKITAHLPALTAKFARDRLVALAQSEGVLPKDVPVVLFVCVHNAGRSQMAAALLEHFAGGRVQVRSAGSAPADSVHPVVLDVMAEIGIDMSQTFPKPLTDDVVQAADVVVTMGCGDACPVYPGKRYEDWELPDPVDASPSAARQLREQIAARVQQLLAALDLPSASSATSAPSTTTR